MSVLGSALGLDIACVSFGVSAGTGYSLCQFWVSAGTGQLVSVLGSALGLVSLCQFWGQRWNFDSLILYLEDDGFRP